MDADGVPLAVRTSPANIHDCVPAIQLLDSIPPIAGLPGRPWRRPGILIGDRAYGSASNIAETRKRGILPMLARPRTEHGSGLGVLRYVIERALACFGHFRRIKLCYERIGSHFQAFHDLAAALLCVTRSVNAEI